MRNVTLIALSMMYSVGMAHAETGFTLPPAIDPSTAQSQQAGQTANQSGGQNSAQTQSLVSGGQSSAFGQETGTSLSPTTGSTERQANQNQASNLGSQGQSNANAAGAALTAIGSSMVATGILTNSIPMIAAGTTLIGQGAMEFAQAGQDGQNSSTNKNGANTIAQPNGEGSEESGSSTPSTATTPQLSSDLQNALQSQGIDPDQFLSGLASSNYDPNQALNSLGLGNLSPEQQEQANSLANQQLSETLGPDNGKALTLNEGAPADGQAGLVQAGAKTPGNGSGKGLTGDLPAGESHEEAVAANIGLRNSPANGSGGASGQTDIPANPNAALQNWVGAAGASVPEGVDPRAFVISELKQNGVLVMPKGENIFQKAHHHFQAFRKWTKGERVAQR